MKTWEKEMKRLTDKVIVVAGAGGIGNELAHRYASEGARVVLGDCDVIAARKVADSIAAVGGQIRAVELDGGDDASVKALVDVAVSVFGGLDGFHANYASFRDGQVVANAVDLPLDVFDEVMRINMRGFLLCTRHAVPAMIARGGGSIIYTSSGAAYVPATWRVAYGMSKAAIHALMRHVALTWGPSNIRANVIAPGMILHEKLLAGSATIAERSLKDQAFKGRTGEPADIAAMGALLMSTEGAFISGEVINVNGGSTMIP
jgi:NAD(P)-dependent dehydrogenase (short-subunit alcohol dehydrogenase family)